MRFVVALMLVAFVLVFYASVDARTWYILPDGTGDAPTIQAGIDSSVAGDTVLVACGTYHDCTHTDRHGDPNCIIMKSGVVLRSEKGQPECVIIDAQRAGRVMYCEDLDNTTVIEGLTLTGGFAKFSHPGDHGGAVYIEGVSGNSDPTFRNCIISNNEASNGSTGTGGGICMVHSSSLFESVQLIDNTAQVVGGAVSIYYSESQPTFRNCLVNENSAGQLGGGFFCSNECALTIEDCWIYDNHYFLEVQACAE